MSRKKKHLSLLRKALTEEGTWSISMYNEQFTGTDEKGLQLVIVDPEIEQISTEDLLTSMLRLQQGEESTDISRPEGREITLRKPDQLTLLERVSPEFAPFVGPNYPQQPERAVREASLVPFSRWEEDSGILSYLASNYIEVSLGTLNRPLDIEAARKEFKKLGGSTVVVNRLLFTFFNARVRMGLRGKNGAVPILISELLQRMGIERHYKDEPAYKGSMVKKRYTDGYRADHKRRLIRDVALLSAFYVRARSMHAGLPAELGTRGRYIHVDLAVDDRTERLLGIWFLPGSWFNLYGPPPQHPADEAFARMDAAISKLNPQNDQHELYIAMYLSERWRDAIAAPQETSQRGRPMNTLFTAPITMADLLSSSVITVDKDHITDRFAPRIEGALRRLQIPDPETGLPIIGGAYPVTPIDYEQAQWGKRWLQAQWVFLPPSDLQAACGIDVLQPPLLIEPPKPPIKTKRTRKRSTDQ